MPTPIDNKLLLVTAIWGCFMGLEQSQLVQLGWTVDLDVHQAGVAGRGESAVSTIFEPCQLNTD